MPSINRKAARRLVNKHNLPVSGTLLAMLASKLDNVPCSEQDAKILRQATRPTPTAPVQVYLVVGKRPPAQEEGFVHKHGLCLASCTTREEAEQLAKGRKVVTHLVSEDAKIVAWRKFRDEHNLTLNQTDQGVTPWQRKNSVAPIGSRETLREAQNRVAETLAELGGYTAAHIAQMA